jgi:hypothetical protein
MQEEDAHAFDSSWNHAFKGMSLNGRMLDQPHAQAHKPLKLQQEPVHKPKVLRQSSNSHANQGQPKKIVLEGHPASNEYSRRSASHLNN